jgi:hypothetical protein
VAPRKPPLCRYRDDHPRDQRWRKNPQPRVPILPPRDAASEPASSALGHDGIRTIPGAVAVDPHPAPQHQPTSIISSIPTPQRRHPHSHTRLTTHLSPTINRTFGSSTPRIFLLDPGLLASASAPVVPTAALLSACPCLPSLVPGSLLATRCAVARTRLTSPLRPVHRRLRLASVSPRAFRTFFEFQGVVTVRHSPVRCCDEGKHFGTSRRPWSSLTCMHLAGALAIVDPRR